MAGIDTAPSCVQHGVSAVDGTVAPYQDCAGFFTFGPGGTFNADDPGASAFFLGASAGTVLLVIIGFIVFVAVMVAWVKVEDDKLTLQAMRLRGLAPGGPPGPTPPGPGLTSEP